MKRESVVSAIKNGAPAPQFKYLILTVLCGVTHKRIVLPDMLDYYCLCCLNLVPLSSSRGGVRKYLIENFLHVNMFYHILLGYLFVVCLDPSLAKDSC